MIKGLSEFEKYRVLRPIIGGSKLDKYGFPILDKEKLVLATSDGGIATLPDTVCV